MGTHAGREGTVKKGSNTIAEILSYQITETAGTIEGAAMGAASKTVFADEVSAAGSMECYWDETDTNGQQALTVGAAVTLNIYPEGATTGDQYGTCSAIITSVGVSAAKGGVVTRSFSFVVNGVITWH